MGFHSEVTVLCNTSSCQGGRGGGIWENAAQLFISTVYLLNQARHGKNIHEDHFKNAPSEVISYRLPDVENTLLQKERTKADLSLETFFYHTDEVFN